MLVCGLTVAPSPPRLPLFRRGAVSYILIRSRTPVPLSPSLLLPSSLKPLGDPLRSTARPPGGVMWCDVFLTACLMEPWWSGRPFWSASAGARRPTLPLWLSPCSLAAPRLASGCPSLLRASIFYSLNEVRPSGSQSRNPLSARLPQTRLSFPDHFNRGAWKKLPVPGYLGMCLILCATE